MPSKSLAVWFGDRAEKLDEIAGAHVAVGGAGRGRRYATTQINHAYTVLLLSQFQGFCRDLHSEVADHLSAAANPRLGLILRASLTSGRKLDVGNATSAGLGSDFGRLGVQLWDEVRSLDARARVWRERLDVLASWRNAIAHQDFTKVGGGVLRLQSVREWRRTCDGLARVFDGVAGRHIDAVVGSIPW